MNKSKQVNKITALAQQIEETRSELAQLEAQYAELRLEALRQVEMTRVGATTTLVFDNRVIKVKRNRWGRLKITEGQQTLNTDYIGGIHDLRFALAVGTM